MADEKWTFDWHKEPNHSFLKWLLPTLLGKIDNETWEKITEATAKSSDVQITVQINGIEVNPKYFLESLERNYELNTAAEAKNIIDTKFENLDQAIEGLNILVERARQSMIKHLQNCDIEIRGPEDEW